MDAARELALGHTATVVRLDRQEPRPRAPAPRRALSLATRTRLMALRSGFCAATRSGDRGLAPQLSEKLDEHSVSHVSGSINPSEGRVCFQLKNGLFLRAVFPYKTGSTEWLRLLVLHLAGVLIHDPHWPPWTSHLCNHNLCPVPAYTPEHIASHGGKLMRILITRSPYERMLSAYMDKVVEHGQIFLAPPGVRKNSTFGEFVHAAIRDHRDPSRIHGVAMQLSLIHI